MPIKLIPPRQGRSPNWRVRGTYLGCYVDESAGTPVKKTAGKKLQKIRAQIERGEFSSGRGPTFMSAAVSYIDAGGDKRFLGNYDPDTGKWTGLIAHFLNTNPNNIDQAAIDRAAITLYPDATPATRNRQVYTPVSAVLKHFGIDRRFDRPEGSAGSERTDWLWPEQAFEIFDAAKKIDAEFGIFLVTLCYTGMRLSDGLKMTCDKTRLSESFTYVGVTKNGQPRGVHLPPIVVAELANHPRGLDRPGERVFRFSKSGKLYGLFKQTIELSGVAIPAGVKFHIFCHTWATWMRRYGRVDGRGLVATGRWDDEKSVKRYQHVVVAEEAMRADILPVPPIKKSKPRTRAKSVERKRKL